MPIVTAANGLTLARLLLAAPVAWLTLHNAHMLAITGFTLAALSDFFDGRLARARNEASATGAIFDHATDALFVTVLLAAAASEGRIAPLLPALIPCAFIQYLLDSRALAGKPLRGNQLGRWNGIAYFVLAGAVVVAPALTPLGQIEASVERLLLPISQLLIATTAISMLTRAYHWWAIRRQARTPRA
ncbi:MAG: CDP-alcohol phosphatidyltransferase family protein [Pseudomonadota bacterium]